MPTDVQAGSAAYDARRRRREDSDVGDIWRIMDSVTDPEIPVVSIWDLGILTDVERRDGTVRVSITPTYCGCPAVDCIRSDIASALRAAGITSFEIRTTLAPAWTTDWISPEGRAKMLAFGIAVPQPGGGTLDGRTPEVTCPRCGSSHTHEIAEFGSTACKSLFQCNECDEPFDYFKRL